MGPSAWLVFIFLIYLIINNCFNNYVQVYVQNAKKKGFSFHWEGGMVEHKLIFG